MEDFITSKELLEVCKTKVAVKFANEDFNKWVNNDFIRLSDEILEHTKLYISPTSLKRIFGKISSDAFPKKSTLDILAKYIDYRDWNDFTANNHPTISIHTDPRPVAKKTIAQKWWIIGAVLFASAIGVVTFLLLPESTSDFTFSIHKTFGKAPYTANFNVAVPNKNVENTFIDFSDPFETDETFLRYALKQNSQLVSHTYMIPGVYHPQLVSDKQILDSLDIPVYSNGWEYVVVNYHEKIRAFYNIKDREHFRQKGIFCIPSTEVIKYNVDTMTGYCMRYLYYKNFNVPSDKLKLELNTCNPILSSTNKCNNIEIQLKFLHWNVGFMLFHHGCNGNYSRVQLGSKVLNGIDSNLSMFEVDLNQWQDLVVEIKNQKVCISANGKIIFQGKIEGDLGSFQGIALNTQQSAKVDYLRLRSGEKILLQEEY